MRSLLFIITVFCSFHLFAQTTDQAVIKIKGITTDGKSFSNIRLKDVTINVYEANNIIATYPCDDKGRFEFDIPLNDYIVLEFVKDGYFAKRILFDTQNPNLDLSKTYEPFNFEILMLPYKKDINQYEIDFPITRVEYSVKEKDFIYAEKYTKRMIKKQEEVMNELSKVD